MACITNFFYPSPVKISGGGISELSYADYGKGASNVCIRDGGRLPGSEEARILAWHIASRASSLSNTCRQLKFRLEQLDNAHSVVGGDSTIEEMRAALEKEYNSECLSVNYKDDMSWLELTEILYPGIKPYYYKSKYYIIMYYSFGFDNNSFGTLYVDQYGNIEDSILGPVVEPNQVQATCVVPDTSLCTFIRDNFNVGANDVSCIADSDIILPDDFNLSELSKIKLSNGMIIYMVSDVVVIPDLSDAVDENDREGFIIYVDVNGNSGKSELWKDVFPFYLLKSGKVIPAYKDDEPSGGTSKEHLSANVMYDVFEGGKREVRLLLKDANFRRAACTTGYIKSATYCGEFVQYDICKDLSHDCRLQIKEPIKLF